MTHKHIAEYVKQYKKAPFIPKELSWLSFNERVLQEATDSSVPIANRIKFLGIYSSNLDEFFSVRVGTLTRLAKLPGPQKKLLTHDPAKLVHAVQATVLAIQDQFYLAINAVIKELEKKGIRIPNEKELTPEQNLFVMDYFTKTVRPRLFPVMLGDRFRLPVLKDGTIYLAVYLKKKNIFSRNTYCLIEIPSKELSRFITIPSRQDKKCLMLLDDVIRLGLPEMFGVLGYESFEAYCFKVSRDSALNMDDDLSTSYTDKIFKSIQRRKRNELVRFVYDKSMPVAMRRFFANRLRISNDTPTIPGGRYHNFKDFLVFPDLLKEPSSEYPTPLPHKDISKNTSIFTVLQKKDVLLHFPYQSYDVVLGLLREAAVDPDVTSISITLYRLAKISSVINALINAHRNGKRVWVMLELQARFDEEANFNWAHRLEEEGITVNFGIKEIKVHSKLCLISRKKANVYSHYAVIGTGNFNEDTAKMYTDHYLLTGDIRITKEVAEIFKLLEKNFSVYRYKNLMVSPINQRTAIERLVMNEIANVKAGKPAYIHIKINNLADEKICLLLYKASEEGVEIRLIVRGMFGLIAGHPVLSKNIDARCVVDKYLEHGRMMFFANGGDELCYITSADLLTRNLDSRIEVSVPIYDKNIHKELRDIFDICWRDNTKARHLRLELSNQYVKNGERPVRAQNEIYNYLKKIHKPN